MSLSLKSGLELLPWITHILCQLVLNCKCYWTLIYQLSLLLRNKQNPINSSTENISLSANRFSANPIKSSGISRPLPDASICLKLNIMCLLYYMHLSDYRCVRLSQDILRPPHPADNRTLSAYVLIFLNSKKYPFKTLPNPRLYFDAEKKTEKKRNIIYKKTCISYLKIYFKKIHILQVATLYNTTTYTFKEA